MITRAAQLGFTIDPADSVHDDRPGIEVVLNAAASGSTLYFADGTYNLLSPSSAQAGANIAVSKSGIRLEGQSRAGTVFKSSFDDAGSASYTGIELRGVHDVVLSNFTLTTTWNRSYSTQTSGNNTDRGGLTYAIAVGADGAGTAAHDIVIDNVLVEKFRRMGVRIAAGSHDVTVRNSLARNATDVGDGGAGYGFVIQGAGHQTAAANPYLGDAARDTYYVLLDNNRTEGPYIRHAALIQYWAHHNLVRGNVFADTQLDAIDLHGEDEYANEIASNTVQRARRAGIGLGNSGAGHDRSGVANWIHHNDLVACAWGITVQYGTTGTTIEDNTIRDTAGPVAVSNPAGAILGKSSASVLRNNLFANNGVAGYVAVVLADDRAEGEEAAGGPTDWTLAGNRVQASGTPFADQAALDANNRIQTSW